MKIIKPGITEKQPLVFTCDYCYCVFEADSDEYSEVSQTDYQIQYRCICPTCGRPVYCRRNKTTTA